MPERSPDELRQPNGIFFLRDRGPYVNMKSTVPPAAHFTDEFATDETFGNQKLVNVGFKQFAEDVSLKQRSRQKGIRLHEKLLGNQRMKMRIPVEKIFCRLDRKDRSG